MPPPEPVVVIGLRLSIEPKTLPASSTEPIYLVLTARILKTPEPDLPVTFTDAHSPFEPRLRDGKWTDMVLVNTFEGDDVSQSLSDKADSKRIKTGKRFNITRVTRGPNLAKCWPFLTVPPQNQGTLVVKQEVSHDIIAEADIKPGERYQVSLTTIRRHSAWWGFGDLKGKRPRMYESPQFVETRSDEELAKFHEEFMYDEESARELRRPIEEAGAWQIGGDPSLFRFEVEDDGKAGTAEFEVVADEMALEGLRIQD